MSRNLLNETIVTHAFAHFPDGPNLAIRSDEVRPVFEALPADEQEFITDAAWRRNPRDFEGFAQEIGVSESVAVGLLYLIHPDA